MVYPGVRRTFKMKTMVIIMKKTTLVLTLIIALVLSLSLVSCDINNLFETSEATSPETTEATAPETSEDEHLGDPYYSSEFTKGLLFRLDKNDNTYYIYNFYGKETTEVIIPRIYKGCYVTAIGKDVFKDYTDIVSVSLPDTLTYIGDSAFENCSSLTKVNLPDGLLYIGKSAFKGCSKFTSFVVPPNVTYIGEGAFNGFSNLESIVLPFIGLNYGIPGQYKYANSLGIIFGRTKYDNSVKTTQYVRLDSIISTYHYYLPKKLKSVTILGGEIPYGAFHNCSRLENIILPEDITAIAPYSFNGCSSLTSFTIPDGVTDIGAAAFYDCYNIKSINIPNGVSRICSIAFKNCTDLTNINFDGTMEEWENIYKFDDWDDKTGNYTVYCSDGNISK